MKNDNSEEIKLTENLTPTDFEVVKAEKLPTEINFWTKVKNVLLYEIKIELSPKQEKILKEVSDFWHQDIKDISFKQIREVFNFKK